MKKMIEDFKTPADYFEYVLNNQNDFADESVGYITLKVGEENVSFSDMKLKKALMLALEALEEIGSIYKLDDQGNYWSVGSRLDKAVIIAEQAALTLNAIGYYTEEVKNG